MRLFIIGFPSSITKEKLDPFAMAVSTATVAKAVVNMRDLQKAAEVVVTVVLNCKVPAPGTDRPRKVQRVLDVNGFTDLGEKAVARLEASVATLGTTMKTDMGTKCAAERQHLDMKIAELAQQLAVLKSSLHYNYITYTLWILTLIYLFFFKK